MGCETSRLPHFVGSLLTDSGEVVSFTLQLSYTVVHHEMPHSPYSVSRLKFEPYTPSPKYRVFKKQLYSVNPNVTVWRVLRKRSHLKAYKLYVDQSVERRVVCTPVSVNVFLTLSTP
jgi:hypothetical protein